MALHRQPGAPRHRATAWWSVWVVAGLVALSCAAMAQSPGAATPDSPGTLVIKPKADVDPGIRVEPPVPPSRMNTPVIAPPGSPGGDPTVQPK